MRVSRRQVAPHALAAGLGLVPVAILAWAPHARAVARGQQRLSEVARSLAGRCDNLIRDADDHLTRLTADHAGDPPATVRRRREYNDPRFREFGVIDPAGRLVRTNRGDKPDPVPAAERSDPADPGLQVVGTLRTTEMQEVSIVLAKPTGRGLGEVNVLVDPGLFTLLVDDVGLGAGGFLAVAAADGRPLATMREGTNFVDRAWLTGPAQAGRLRADVPAGDGRLRVVAEAARGAVTAGVPRDVALIGLPVLLTTAGVVFWATWRRRAGWIQADLIHSDDRSARCVLFPRTVRSGPCGRWWCPYCRYRLTRLMAWRFLLAAETAERTRQRRNGAVLSLVQLEASMAPFAAGRGWRHPESQRRWPWGPYGWMLRPSTADLQAGWIFGGPAGRLGLSAARPGRAAREADPVAFGPSGRSAVPDHAFPGRVMARLSVFQPVQLRMPMAGVGGSETSRDDRSDWPFTWGVRESVVALCWVYPPGRPTPGRPARNPRGTAAGVGPLGQPLTPASHCRLMLSPLGGHIRVGRFAPAVRPATSRALAAAVGRALRLPGWVGRGPVDGLFPYLTPTQRSAPIWRPIRHVVAGGVVLHRTDATAFLVAQTPGAGDARWRRRGAADPAAVGRLMCRQAVALAATALDGPVPTAVVLTQAGRRKLVRTRTLAADLDRRLRLAPGRLTGPGNAGVALRRTLQARRLRAVVLDLVSALGLPRASRPALSSRPRHPTVSPAHPG